MRMTVAMNASGAEDAGRAHPSTVLEYEARRAEALSTEGLSIPPEWGDRPYRVVIEETALGGRWTLIVFATGESRLLLSNGPDIIGRPTDSDAAEKASDLVEAAGRRLHLARPTSVLSSPKMGTTGFHFLTGQGLFTAGEKTSVLRDGESALSPLLTFGDDLIARLIEKGLDRRKKPEPKRARLPTTLALIALALALTYTASFIQSPGLRWMALAIGVSLVIASLLVPIITAVAKPERDD